MVSDPTEIWLDPGCCEDRRWPSSPADLQCSDCDCADQDARPKQAKYIRADFIAVLLSSPEMVERVARAICAVCYPHLSPDDGEGVGDPLWSDCIRDAEAALAAVREAIMEKWDV